jgi:hypothetical protein
VDVRDLARDERVDLTAFLATLPPQQWRAPTPCDLGEEILGWLRRAYDENAAPPGPQRPARPAAPRPARSAPPGARRPRSDRFAPAI